MMSPLYAQLPETTETHFAREMSEILSEVQFCCYDALRITKNRKCSKATALKAAA